MDLKRTWLMRNLLLRQMLLLKSRQWQLRCELGCLSSPPLRICEFCMSFVL